MSFENLTGGPGVLGFANGVTATGEDFLIEADLEDPALAAMLVRVDWHFSCCFLNLSSFSCSAIYAQQHNPQHSILEKHKDR